MKRIYQTLCLCAVMGTSGCGSVTATLNPEAHLREEPSSDGRPARFGSSHAYEHVLRADLLAARGDTESAIGEMKQALAGDGDYLLRVKLAQLLIAAKDFSAARTQLARAVSQAPTAGQPWVAVADLHLAMGSEKEAVAAAAHGVRVDAVAPDALLWLARYYLAPQPATALSYCRRALSRLENVATLAVCAQAAGAARRPNLERTYWLRHVQLGGTQGEELEELEALAQRRFDGGDIAGGVALLESLVAGQPMEDATRERLIEHLLQLGLAERVPVHVLLLGPCDEDGVLERAGWLAQANQPWEARMYLVNRVGENPVQPVSRLRLAELEATLGRVEVAVLLLRFPEGQWPAELLPAVNALKKTLSNVSYPKRTIR